MLIKRKYTGNSPQSENICALMYNWGNVTSTAVCFRVTFKRTFKLSFWGAGGRTPSFRSYRLMIIRKDTHRTVKENVCPHIP